MTRRVIALVQARMGSARLPGKVMAEIAGRPMYEHVVRRAAAAPGVDDVWLCVAENAENAPLIEHARALKPLGVCLIPVGQTQPPDVLGLFAEVAGDLLLDTVLVRLTADCPSVDPQLIAECVRRREPDQFLTTSVSDQTGFPDGQDIEVFDVGMLVNAAAAATGSDREHVTPWMRGRYNMMKLGRPADKVTTVKLSVDTAEELAFTNRLHRALGSRLWGMPAISAYLQGRL